MLEGARWLPLKEKGARVMLASNRVLRFLMFTSQTPGVHVKGMRKIGEPDFRQRQLVKDPSTTTLSANACSWRWVVHRPYLDTA